MAPGNPLGAVPLYDSENPRTFTARALEAVSGGDLVMCSGANNVVSSGADTFATSDMVVALSDDNQRGNGLAIATVGSNSNVAIATRGDWILKAGGSVFPGTLVETIGDEVAVQTLSSGGVPTGLHTRITAAKAIGRSKTAAASGGFAVISLGGLL